MIDRRSRGWTAALASPWIAFALLANATAAEPAAAEPVAAPSVDSPLSPEQALAEFRLDPGLRIELVASEPEIVDPVAARFDEDGRLWVVEMRDYPNGPPAGQPPLSRIRILEDRDVDGRFETASTFADRLDFPTGLQPWRGGVIVTLAGRVAYLKDEDGDGRCDRDETWYHGFAIENPQLRANHPRFALDNHVYVANGLRGGKIVAARGAERSPVDIAGRDFRFDPHSGLASAATGHGQFGLAFDDFGRRFVCSNRNPLVQVMLEDRYLARNPFFAAPAAVHDVVAAGEASRVQPLSQAWTTSILHAGQFTAACGVDIYRGDALPAEYWGNAFTCEPTGSLVHRELLEWEGAAYTGHPANSDGEFLASRDAWFRPVNLEQGPDGALYIVDMYRAVIEHPEWVPEELRRRPDERHGDDKGRIWRIVDSRARRAPARPRLSRASIAELVATLGSSNAWQRETAARLIYERQDQTAAPLLERLAMQPSHDEPSAAARVQALGALAGLGQLTAAALEAAAADPHPAVREQAMLLSETTGQRLPTTAWQALLADEHPRVRFQAVLSLGNDAPLAALAAVALAGARDRWTRYAVATCVADRPADLLVAVLEAQASGEGGDRDSRLTLVGDLARLVGARANIEESVAAIEAAIRASEHDPYDLVAWNEIGQSLAQRGISLREWATRKEEASLGMAAAARTIFASARRLVGDHQRDGYVRGLACSALAHAPDDVLLDTLAPLVAGESDASVKARMLHSLAECSDPQVHAVLIAEWPRQTPALRPALLDAILAHPDRVLLFLDEIASGRVRAAELDTVRIDRLLKHSDPRVREKSAPLFKAADPAERAEVFEKYKRALSGEADPRRGREVFRKECATCHRIGGLGVDVAPSIADERTKTLEQLLVDVLQPSRTIDNNYLSYTVAAKDGRTFTGIIASESSASVALKLAEGKTVSLLRSDIDEIQSNGVSLMPEGLERNVSPQAMLDVLSFIKRWRYLEGGGPAPGADQNP